MYRMIIIDDEPIVRAGLKKILNWDEFQIEICAEGIDGVDGLKKVIELQPDIIMVDMKMPGMNGIELIRKAQEQGYQGKVIILTGYSDFDFARSAITLGVRAYLLKPVDEDELEENIRIIIDELKSKKLREASLSLNRKRAREEAIRRMCLCLGDKGKIAKEIKTYNLDFNYNRFCVAILINASVYTIPSQDNLSDEIIDCMLNNMGSFDKIIVEDKIVLIIKGSSYKDIKETLKQNNERVKRRYGAKYFITIGHDVIKVEDIYFSYECANMLQTYKFLYKEQEIVTIEALEQIDELSHDILADELSTYIDVNNIEKIETTLINFSDYCKSKLMSESEIKVKVTQTMIQVQNILANNYEEKKMEFPDINEFTEKIKTIHTLEELVEEEIYFCMNMSQVIGNSNTDNVIKRMYTYMENNYNQDLKLANIAKMFNYNSAYLGKVFKKEMGESFNNIMDNIRIHNAKLLLADTELKVYLISEQVGYTNIDYFYSKFKKYVGISPKEFRKNIKKGHGDEDEI